MLSILFWNTFKKELSNSLINIAEKYEPDIFILAESALKPGKFLDEVNGSSEKYSYKYVDDHCSKLEFYTKIPKNWIQNLYDEERFSIKKLTLFDVDFIVCGVHLSDNIYNTKGSIYSEAENVKKCILREEKERKTQNSIVIGDFNMNPFEEGFISAYKFSSVNSKHVSAKRTIKKKEFEVFYNPSWKFYSDTDTSGTFYLQNSEYDNHYWNIFDQVLLRPNLLEYYSEESLTLLKSDGKNSLISDNGRPDKGSFSDHLPIFLNLTY